MVVKSGAAAKKPHFPFVFNEPPCGPAAVATAGDFFYILFLFRLWFCSVYQSLSPVIGHQHEPKQHS